MAAFNMFAEETGNPIFLGDDGWYFWDEAQFNVYGPYSTKEEAKEKLEEYCKELGQ